MEENNNVNVNGTEGQVNGAENAGQEIVIQEGGKVRKALKWVLGGVAFLATGVAGFLLGRGTKGDDGDDNADPAEAESPAED